MDVLILLLLVFLAGVGLGTFVLGARIRKVVAEAVAYVKAEEQKAKSAEAKVEQKFEQIKKAL